MDIYQYLDAMLPYLNKRDWATLERDYQRIASRLAGPEMAADIAAIDTTSYEDKLQASMASAYEKARQVNADSTLVKAIYFEYDLDNSWQSCFFVCSSYNPPQTINEDWACDWVAEVEGPTFEAFGKCYQSTSGFDVTDRDKGTTLYLVARTVAAFGRCTERLKDEIESQPYALCIAFHEQCPIMRIKEWANLKAF